ncbi:MAG: hypothetical protein QM820_04845 [Minicystis sp.]
MANKLGAAFLRCSLGPLNYAGGCILSSKVEQGLSELSADNLHGGLKRGIEETAQKAGVGVVDVERLLPMQDITSCAARLDMAQRNALEAWRTYAGHLGGLMKGVADLTVDGRAPDVSHFLARLSKKVVRDRPLSEPLEALSHEVASWLDLVERCGDLIGDGDVLTRAYRRRRLQRFAVIGAAGAVCVSAIGVVIWIHAVRARVDAALSAADPCAAAAIDPGDLARASGDQQRLAGERRAACDEAKKREAEARAAQEKREAEAREAEARKREQEARCEALSQHLAAGTIGPEDAAAAGASAALLGRVAKSALEAADSDGDGAALHGHRRGEEDRGRLRGRGGRVDDGLVARGRRVGARGGGARGAEGRDPGIAEADAAPARGPGGDEGHRGAGRGGQGAGEAALPAQGRSGDARREVLLDAVRARRQALAGARSAQAGKAGERARG